MKGIKKHSHSDREKVVGEMLPLIKRKFGDNLIAVAAFGSYARREDYHYSDLELVAFVKKMPVGKPIDGLAKIRDGLLVELMWMTEETYYKTTRDLNQDWYMSGSDILYPIFNKRFTDRANNYKVENLKQKCLERAVGGFAELQESTTKVLNAISQKNRNGMPILLLYLVNDMLCVLSLLNQTPYVTMNEAITQAKRFKLKPRSFHGLIDILVEGKYTRLRSLQKAVISVFSEFEVIFEGLGQELYDDNVDPNTPVHKFRKWN